MEIMRVRENKRQFMDLLLQADERESMIDRYLERGELFVLYDDESPRCVGVVTREGDDVCELKNIAVDEKWRDHGYGSRLLHHLFEHYRGEYTTMLVGTGDAPRIVQFYQRNGFTISHRVENFFTDNYDHAMFEDGVQLVDMVYLSRTL